MVASRARDGLSPADLTVRDLARYDQLHLGGLDATLELLALAGVARGERVLDLGGGMGGSARVLASRTGCHVTVVDVVPAFCEAGEAVTSWLGLGDHVRFLTGDATAPPVPDASFDVVWTQHASMNIADKHALYHAAARALVPGGRLVLHDIMGDDGMDDLLYPVPWATRAEQSPLVHTDEQRTIIRGAGFTERTWQDVTAAARAWLAGWLHAPQRSLLAGSDEIRVQRSNLLRNLEEGRLRVIRAVLD